MAVSAPARESKALYLLFQFGSDRYALEASPIVEILPLVPLKRHLRQPPGVAGSLNYHGDFVPVIDMSELATGRAAPARLSTRIIVARFKAAADRPALLGIICENATEMMRCEPSDFVQTGIASEETPYLGPIRIGRDGLIQLVDIDRLLTASLRDFLFKQPADAQ
jgi:chemotaxis-related protein WspB